MSNIVYLLGAGFSAPLGFPVMSDFIEKSKDLYFGGDRNKYAYFKEVFGLLARLSVIKNYAHADLFNIEEVLSLLEMEDFVSEQPCLMGKYKQYIKDVIIGCSPDTGHPGPDPNMWPTNWLDDWAGTNELYRRYAYFVCGLLNVELSAEGAQPNLKLAAQVPPSRTSYSVVTLNYDMIIEGVVNLLNDVFRKSYHYFRVLHGEKPSADTSYAASLHCAKLHGSLDGEIVAPTWNKIGSEAMQPIWRQAYDDVKNATHLRIIGYSLPVTDTHVRYLILAGLKHTEHLKSIDVICLDPDGAVEKRYRASFGEYPKFRFVKADVSAYLKAIVSKRSSRHEGATQFVSVDIEDMHERFMEGYGQR